MGKIKRTPTRKHLLSQPRFVRDFVRHTTASVALHDLPRHLAQFPSQWLFPRGDLHHWIPLLNRFDTILEAFVEKYQLNEGPQCKAFSRALLLGEKIGGLNSGKTQSTSDQQLTNIGYGREGDRELVEAVVRFTGLLFEHCGSRSIYVSSAHLNSLLNTTSLSLVDATLRLCLQLAQRYSSARRSGDPSMSDGLLQTYYQIDLKKLSKLAQPIYDWPKDTQKPHLLESSSDSTSGDQHSVDYLELVESNNLKSSDWENLAYSLIELIRYSPSDHQGLNSQPQSPTSPTPNRRWSGQPAPDKTQSLPDDTSGKTVGLWSQSWSKNIQGPYERASKEITIRALGSVPPERLIDGTMAVISFASDLEKYEALDKLRVAQAILESDATRQDLAATRLLAVANLAYIHSDHSLHEALQFESDAPRHLRLPHQLCKLVHPLGQGQPTVPKRFQTLAMRTLTALCKHKSRVNDVSAALNVNVNHGVLSFVTRKAVSELSTEDEPSTSQEDRDWRESIFSLLHELPRANSRNAEAIISAGLLEILVEALGYRTRKALLNHPRVLQFFDVFTYNKRETLRSLASANGLDAISELLSHEVEVSLDAVKTGQLYPDELKTRTVDFQIPYEHQQVLHAALTLIYHMVINNQGTFDRQLRNVMESSQLLSALKTIIMHPHEYGSALWRDALQVFGNFLHSEPTSFGAMSEMGLNKAVLEVVTGKPLPTEDNAVDDSTPAATPASSLLPSALAVTVLPDVLNAICLNEVGLNQVRSSNVLGAFFSVFCSAPHVRALADATQEEGLEELGSTLDELARHHPSLKPAIIEEIAKTTKVLAILLADSGSKERNEDLLFPRPRHDQIISEAVRAEAALQRLSIPETFRNDAEQEGSSNPILSDDVEMADVTPSTEQTNAQTQKPNKAMYDPNQATASSSDYIGVFSRFLYGFFGNTSHCQTFLDTPAFERLLDVATCPGLPPDFNNASSTTATRLILVFQVLIEQKPHLTLPSLISRVLSELDSLSHFLDYSHETPYFAPFMQDESTSLSAEEQERKSHGSATAQALVHVQTLCSILSKGLIPHNNRSSASLLSAVNLADKYMQLIKRLGKLLQKTTYEEATLSTSLPPSFIRRHNNVLSGLAQPTPSSVPATGTSEADPTVSSPVAAQANEQEATYAATNQRSNTDPKFPHRAAYNDADYNYACTRHFIYNCPKTFTGLLTTIGRALLPRRIASDIYPKQNTFAVADCVGAALIAQIPNIETDGPENFTKPLLVYYEHCITNIGRSLTERRSEYDDWTNASILTLIVQSFKKRNGLKKLGYLLQALITARIKSTEPDKDNNNPRQGSPEPHLLILRLFDLLVNDKKTAEAPQTQSLSGRGERDREKPDYFSAPQFTVEMRCEATRFVSSIWQSDQIEKLDVPSVKTLLRVLKHVLESDGEYGSFKRSDKVNAPRDLTRRPWRLKNATHLNSIEERGIPHDLAMEAMYRCNDNQNAAAEYGQKYVNDPQLARNPIPEYDAPPAELPSSASTGEGSSGTTENSQNHESPSTEHVTLPSIADILAGPTPFTSDTSATDPSNTFDTGLTIQDDQEWMGKEPVTVDDLDDMRSMLRDGLIDRCLGMLYKFTGLTFELADLILASVSKSVDALATRQDICSTLVQSIVSYQGTADSLQENGSRIDACAHMLGIILQEQEFFTAASDDLRDSFSTLSSFVTIPQDSKPGEAPTWIASVLLILERALAEDAQPRQIHWTPPTSNSSPEEAVAQLEEPMVSEDDRSELFDKLLDVLPRIGKNAKLGLAVVRVLVPLTRTRKLAARLGSRKNLQRLFVMVKQLSGLIDDKFQTAFMIVIRHAIEDEATIRQIMRSEIIMFFEKYNRPVDTTQYTRPLAHLIVRAPDIFIEVTNELVTLPRFDRNQNPQSLTLKKESSDPDEVGGNDQDKAENNEQEDGSGNKSDTTQKMDVDRQDDHVKPSETSFPVVENPDGIIHFMLSELLAYKDIEDKDVTPGDTPLEKSNAEGDTADTSQPPAKPVQKEKSGNDKETFKAEDHPIFMYRALLLQSLTELLKSYTRTKLEFISYSRRLESQSATPSKPRSGVLNYLLNGIIPTGSLEHAQDIPSRKRSTISYWARQAVVGLCARTVEKGSTKTRDESESEDEPDLAYVRRFVLEHALKAFKDVSTSSDPQELKYSRMLCLSDVFTSLLQPKTDQQPPHRSIPDEQSMSMMPTQKQIARMMYDKGFIAALNHAMAEVDLTFPHANRAIKYILRPLKLLTSTAVELSQTMDASSTSGQTDETEISSATSDTDYEAREETPDLFRNSTLGMFEPGRAEESSSESEDDDDDEDEDMYDERYADDMEFEDGEEDGEEEDTDEDEEMGDAGPIEGLPGEMAMDVQIDFDEGESDDEDLEDSSMESDDSSDDDEGDFDDDEHVVDVEVEEDDEQVIHEHEDELASDEDVPPVGFAASSWGAVEDASDHNEETFVPGNALSGVIGELAERAIDGDPDEDGEEDSDEDGAEDAEDDYDEEDVMFDEPDVDDDEIGGFPPLMSSRRHRHHHHHHHHPFPFYRSHGMMDVHGDRHMYRVHNSRPSGGPPGAVENTNPLLDRGQQRPPERGVPMAPSERRAIPGFPLNLPGMRELSNLQRSLGEISSLSTLIQALGGGPNILQAFQQHGAHTHGDGTVHLTLGPVPTNASLTINQPSSAARGVDPTGRSPRDTHNPFHALPFFPTPTVSRWQEEARLLFGNSYTDKGQKIINSILKLLVPPAIEAERVRKEREAEAKRKEEERRKERELREEEERQEREALERALKEKEEKEAAEAAAQAEQAALEATENMDVSEAERRGSAVETAADGEAMEGIVESGTSAERGAESSNAPSQQTRPPVHITIRGREVDIANLGIDLEYLQAIPEELREEVIIQQVSEQRSQQRSAGEEPTAIDQEFLDALPTEIREELLQQEAQDRRRQEREEARRNAAAGGTQHTAEEMDPADFVASLDPHLRQTVLAEADEETLARLPGYMLAEARALGGHRRTGIDPSRMLSGDLGLSEVLGGARARNRESQQQQDSKVQKRPIIQMLDKAAVAGLLRLMFFNLTGNARSNFNGTIQNASGNRQTRGEIVTGLLSILQEGSTDVQTVERSLNQLTIRARQAIGPKTPQSSKKNDPASISPDTTPSLVVGNCLSALVFLTQQVPHVSHFFLTEHELSAVFKSKSSRKGKAKESKSSKYPINSLLVLLDRSLIIQNASVMETLAGLLHSVTHPLNALLKKEKDESTTQTNSDSAPRADTNVDGNEAPNQPSEAAEAPAEAAVPAIEEGSANNDEPNSNVESKSATEPKKPRTLEPPEISEDNLRLVVNILTARECSSKTFRDTLSVMTNLSAVPRGKEVFGKELVTRARELGQAIHKDLVQFVKSLHSVEDEMQAQSLALANFSPAGSDQAKLSRILTALDYLFEEKDKQDQKKSYFPPEGEDLLTGLVEDPVFSDLWQQLSSCLTATQTSDHYFFNVATILLPLIESLMVMCKRITLRESQQPPSATPKDLATPTFASTTESGIARVFITFTNKHKKILNDLVRHNPKLMSGSFSVLVKNPTILEFDNKRNYFTRRLHQRSLDMRQYPHPGSLQLNIRRDYVFLDSYASLHFKTANEIKYGKLNIRFQNEEGVDAGGVTREWFQVLARQMFNADYALFNPVASDRTTFHPNPLSEINPEHIQFFKFVGRIIGKALYENRVLDCHFSRAVYKRILGKPVSLKDMETIDLDYTKSMEWILENSIDDVISETFSIVVDRFGKEEEIDLMPNGRNIPVTDENKHEYVRLIVEHKLTRAVQEQLDGFLSGFYDIVPLELVSIFDEGELELLISGMPDVDVEDWKNNTEYHNYNANSPQVQWFWRAVRSFDKEERARLLQFVTGTGKVPLNGFQELEGMNGFTRFNIHKDYGNKDRLPSSHTCFNQLDLPEYENYETLRKQLYTAMTTGNEYFGFA